MERITLGILQELVVLYVQKEIRALDRIINPLSIDRSGEMLRLLNDLVGVEPRDASMH